MNLVELVKQGRAYFEYYPLRIDDGERTLIIQVFRDALKVDQAPAMTWSRKAISWDERKFDGLRPPASAAELQEIADYLNCMICTPKVHDLLWDEAGKENGCRFDSVINIHGNIVAISNIHDVHLALEAAIKKAGGDKGGIVYPPGKFWVLCNALLTGKFSNRKDAKGNPLPNIQAVNYGWPSSEAPAHRTSVTKNCRVWQQPGGEHPDSHLDPSQTVVLMYIWAMLLEGGEAREVDLRDIAVDPVRCHLISHEGPLKVLRMPNVPPPARMGNTVYAAPVPTS